MPDQPLLRIDGLTVRFGGLTAVDDVSIEVRSGETVGLIGPNGAGKTTTFGAIVGLVPTTSGRMSVDGSDITGLNTAHRARLGLGRTFQTVQLFGSMTVRGNLEYATEAAAVGARPWRLLTSGRHIDTALVDRVLRLLGLEHVADSPAAAVPLGTSRLVELGRALCQRPRLLLLDEPSSGLPPDETRALGDVIDRVVAEDDLGVLLIEHDMSLVQSTCSRLYVLEYGRLIADGATLDVLSDPRVQSAYLGSEATT